MFHLVNAWNGLKTYWTSNSEINGRIVSCRDRTYIVYEYVYVKGKVAMAIPFLYHNYTKPISYAPRRFVFIVFLLFCGACVYVVLYTLVVLLVPIVCSSACNIVWHMWFSIIVPTSWNKKKKKPSTFTHTLINKNPPFLQCIHERGQLTHWPAGVCEATNPYYTYTIILFCRRNNFWWEQHYTDANIFNGNRVFFWSSV